MSNLMLNFLAVPGTIGWIIIMFIILSIVGLLVMLKFIIEAGSLYIWGQTKMLLNKVGRC